MSKKYRDSPLRKLEKANFVLYINCDGTIEIGKNRYTGGTGLIQFPQGIEILVQVLVGTAFNNTCIVFQEALKKDIYKVLEDHEVLKGEENDKIRRTSSRDGTRL